ncbi:MAG: PAS domain-containing sensor histidine kinase [Kiritimatiellae bacterium]|nr:PAS domain-containing sensor histidine kinase [Kiritimatiellia bacterium]
MKDKKQRPDMTMRIDIDPSELPDSPGVKARTLAAAPNADAWRRRNIPRGSPLFRLFEGQYDAVLITNLEGLILAGNARASTFFQFDISELVGMNMLALISGVTDELIVTIKSNLDNKKFTLVEGFCKRADNTSFAAEIVVNRLDMDQDGQLCFFVRDVSIRHQAQQELQNAVERLQAHDRARMAFVSNVSHELRTPLTSMIYAVNNMLRGVVGPVSEKVLHYLERLQSDCNRLQTTVNDILDLSQIESGKLVLARRVVPLRSVIGCGAETLRVQADAKRIKLNFNFDRREIFISCDNQKMQRVIMNLVGNAVKFTPEDGRIDILLAVDPENKKLALIKVSDSGIGIPADLLPKLSQRYFRVGEHVSGSGLGLAISRELVELHGGTLSFASPVPGTASGTEVSVRLPLADAPLTVFLSNDGVLVDALQKRVIDAGYKLIYRSGASGVVDLFRDERPAVLIIDRRMKGVDVQELIFYFRDAAATKRVPIVLIDSLPLSANELQLFKKFSVFFVMLPLTGRLLENTLASAVMSELR